MFAYVADVPCEGQCAASHKGLGPISPHKCPKGPYSDTERPTGYHAEHVFASLEKVSFIFVDSYMVVCGMRPRRKDLKV